MSDFEKCLHPKKSGFGSFYSVKTTYFAVFGLFWKAWFWIENLFTWQIVNWKNPTRQILNLKKYNASDFEFKKSASNFEFEKIQRVRFWTKNTTTCQILSVLFLHFAKFSFIHQNRACFGNLLMYGLGSISQVILLV